MKTKGILSDCTYSRIIEREYRIGTAPWSNADAYRQFKAKHCWLNNGVSEPHATRSLYEACMRDVHNVEYDNDELDQMEKYVRDHIDVIFSGEQIYTDEMVVTHESLKIVCQKICLSDFSRFTALFDDIVADYKKRAEKDNALWYTFYDFLSKISSGIDCDYLPHNPEKDYLLRWDLRIYHCLSQENLLFLQNLTKKYEQYLKQNKP